MPKTRTEGHPATAEAVRVVMLPISTIRTSPFNYRKTHGGIAELAASIREHGVQQPVKVRPVAGAEDGVAYELVYGERRYRASFEAARSDIPAIVEDLSDEQVQELQLLENTQRADVHPLEEAEGFERMLQVAGAQGSLYTVATLARLVGRSEQYVYGRMQLTRLVTKARAAFYDGKLAASAALLLARVPAALQEKALADILEPRFHGEPMPARLVSELLQQRYMTRLGGAPFAADDAELVPAAGPCTTCPKRTGNAKALFADVGQDDVCTDPTCYRSKVDARWQRAVADARELGRTVLSDKETEKVFLGGNLAYGSTFVDLDERCPSDPKNRTWRRLLKKADPAVTIGRDAHGRPHELVARAEALAALKELGIAVSSGGGARASAAGSAPRSEEVRAAAAKAREDGVLHRAIAASAIEKIVQRVSKKGASRDDLALWLEGVLRGSWSDTVRDVCKRRAIPYDKKSTPAAGLARAAAKMTAPELQALALELGLSRGLYTFYEGAANTFGDVFKRACELHGVDLAELRKGARSARTEKLAARGARKGASDDKQEKKGRPKAA
jgi:ParB family chromosome partitioning protein